MTDRIRWEPTGRGGWTGHVGALAEESWLFQIWSAAAVGGDWQLDSTLPGRFGQHSRADDPATLKADAEFLLAEFASSLGAIFPGALAADIRSRADELEMMVDRRPGQERDNLLFAAGLKRAADLIEHGDRPAVNPEPSPQTAAPATGEKE